MSTIRRFVLICLGMACLSANAAPAVSAGALTVIQHSPQGEVESISQIVVRFSEAVRPLGSMEQDAKSSPLRLTTEQGDLPSGNYRWLDPATLAYLFDRPLAGPYRLRATVSKGCKALSGAALDQDFSWELNSPPLSIRLEESASIVPGEADLNLYSNYALNLDSLKAATSLSRNGRAIPLEIEEEPLQAYGYGQQSAWRYRMSLKQEGDPAPDRIFVLTLKAGVRAAAGGEAAPSLRFEIPGYKSLALESWSAQGADSEHPDSLARPEGGLYLRFNNPVQGKDLLAHLELSPRIALPSQQIAGMEERDQPSTGFHLPFPWAPRGSYTVTVKPGLRDAYGTRLAEAVTFTLNSGDYYPLLLMEQGTLVLERGLGGIVPIVSRNVSPVDLDLRLVPWEGLSRTLLALLTHAHASPGDVPNGLPNGEHTPGEGAKSVHSALSLDFSRQPNRNNYFPLDVDRALNAAPGTVLDASQDAGAYASPDPSPDPSPGASPGSDPETAPNALEPGFIRLRADFVPPQQDGSGQDDQNDQEQAESEERNTHSYFASIQVTNLALHVKMARGEGLAWVSALDSGDPVEGAALTLLDEDGSSLWRGETGPDGLAPLPAGKGLKEPAAFLMAVKGGDVSVLPLQAAALPQSDPFSPGDDPGGRIWRVHSLSQSPLYQPGQTVRLNLYFKALTGSDTDEGMPAHSWRPLANQTMDILVRDSRGKIVHSFRAVSNDFGSVATSLSLPDTADLGYYSLEASSPDLATPCYGPAFQVASFRPPDFKVDLTTPSSRPNALRGDKPWQAALQAGYFSGTPLPGAHAALSVRQKDSAFTPPRLAGYKTGWHAEPFLWVSHPFPPDFNEFMPVADLKSDLDDKGGALFTLPALRADPGSPQTIRLEATVTDASGLTTQGGGEFIVHPSAHYVGLRGPRFVPAGEEARIDFKAATWDNQPLSGVRVRVTAYRHLDENRQEQVWERDIILDDPNGQSLSVRFERAGLYYIAARHSDAEGRENVSRIALMAPGRDMEWLRRSPGSGLDIAAGEEEYDAGSTATLVLSNPFDPETPVRALVSVERDGVLRHWFTELIGAFPSVDVPLTEKDAPYVFASVTLIKGRTAPPPGRDDPFGTADGGRPGMAYGAVCLKLRESGPERSVAVSLDKREYRPGGELRADLSVTLGGRPDPGLQLTVLAVDERVLRAAGEENGYYPELSFGPVYVHGLSSSDTRSLLLNLNLPLLRDVAGEAMLRAMASMDQAVPAPAPAQGLAGGGEGPELRENFDPLAFWLADGISDEQGKLSVSFTLPDTLSACRIVAVAADRANGFATGEASVKVSQPLQLLSALPRFATEGDRLEGRVLVQNNAAYTGHITLNAEAQGMALGAGQRSLTLAPGHSAAVTFPLVFTQQGRAALTVHGSMSPERKAGASLPDASLPGASPENAETERDAVRFVLPVKPAAPLTSVASAGILREGERYRLPLRLPGSPGQALDARSKLSVILAASPAAGLPLTAEAVLNYPWLCLEQRLSKAWVRIMRLTHGDLLGLPPDGDDVKAVRDVLNSVAQFQRRDGSLSLWPGMRGGDLYLTAYALLVDQEAGRADLKDRDQDTLGLDDDVRAQARDYLRASLDRLPRYVGEGEPLSLIPEALALYVLSAYAPGQEGGAGEDAKDLASLAALAESRLLPLLDLAEKSGESSPMVWACLLLALDGMDGTQAEEARILGLLEKNAVVTPTQLHFAAGREYAYWRSLGSNLRDNGLALAALTRTRPDYPRLEALAWWLSQGLGEDPALSTQESVFCLWGLTRYLESLGGDRRVEIEAVWNGGESTKAAFDKLIDAPRVWVLNADKLPAGQDAGLDLRALGGNPYWTARLAYAPGAPTPVTPENAGFVVTREWLTPGPWRMGDVVRVKITLDVPADRRHVLLFDPFPAGLEPLRATRVDLQAEERIWQPPWHWEDMREDGVLLYADQLGPGVYEYSYELRAAAPGEFVRRPGYAEEMYTPEVFGRTGSETVRVLPE